MERRIKNKKGFRKEAGESMTYEELLEESPFGVDQERKEKLFLKLMNPLTGYHREHCHSYQRFLDAFGCGSCFSSLEELPFLPVGIFKKQELKSISDDKIFKVLTSSGTTGQEVSKIYLDEATASNQQKTLARIMETVIGKKRVPMLILDSPKVLKNRRMFSARGAGILGFSILSRRVQFAFDETMQIDLETMQEFLERFPKGPVLVFGFTYMIWEYFYKALKAGRIRLPLERGILIHGGGWKKMRREAVSPQDFKQGIEEVSGISKIYDYYGMAEQTGSISLECEWGHLHVSTYSDVLLRKMEDFSVCKIGEEGVIQVLSPAAGSYPGHSILTEDQGILLGVDDCPCGRKGKYFKMTGRVAHAEVRGCSDTYEG